MRQPKVPPLWVSLKFATAGTVLMVSLILLYVQWADLARIDEIIVHVKDKAAIAASKRIAAGALRWGAVLGFLLGWAITTLVTAFRYSRSGVQQRGPV